MCCPHISLSPLRHRAHPRTQIQSAELLGRVLESETIEEFLRVVADVVQRRSKRLVLLASTTAHAHMSRPVFNFKNGKQCSCLRLFLPSKLSEPLFGGAKAFDRPRILDHLRQTYVSTTRSAEPRSNHAECVQNIHLLRCVKRNFCKVATHRENAQSSSLSLSSEQQSNETSAPPPTPFFTPFRADWPSELVGSKPRRQSS